MTHVTVKRSSKIQSNIFIKTEIVQHVESISNDIYTIETLDTDAYVYTS